MSAGRPAGPGETSAWEQLLIEAWARPWVFGSQGGLPAEVSVLVVTLGVSLLAREVDARLQDRREWGTFSLGWAAGVPVATNHRRGGTFDLELLVRVLPGPEQLRAVIGLGAAGALAEGLEPGDLVVVTRAGRGEGLSGYYLPRAEAARPDAGLERLLEGALEAAGVPRAPARSPARGAEVSSPAKGPGVGPTTAAGPTWRPGPVFTTGALLRETPHRVARWRAEGFCAVECEAAALFALCRFSGLPGALLLVITDSPARGALARAEPELARLRAGVALAVDAVLAVATEVSRR